jgi:hypothetical protein
MTGAGLWGIARVYRDLLIDLGTKPIRISEARELGKIGDLDHALWTVDEVMQMALTIGAVGRSDSRHRLELKAHRWLGFVQGVLWAHGLVSMEELRAHVRDAESG